MPQYKKQIRKRGVAAKHINNEFENKNKLIDINDLNFEIWDELMEEALREILDDQLSMCSMIKVQEERSLEAEIDTGAQWSFVQDNYEEMKKEELHYVELQLSTSKLLQQ